MTLTSYPRMMATIADARSLRRERHASAAEWEPLAEFGPWTPPTDQPWYVAAYCTADVDTGSLGQLRIRSSASSVVTTGVAVSAYARNIRLGFAGVANVPQTIYVEGRRTAGTGGVRLIDARLSAVSAPPPSLVVSGVPVGGGVAEVVPLVAIGGTGGQQTITTPAFSPPANHRLIVVARADRGGHTAAYTWAVSDTGSLGSWQVDATGPVMPDAGNSFARALAVRSVAVGATPPTNITVTVDAWSTTDTGVYAVAVFAVPDPGASWQLHPAAFAYSGTATATATAASPPTGRPVAVFFHQSSDSPAWVDPVDGWVSRMQTAPGNSGAIILAANSDDDGVLSQGTTSTSTFATNGVLLDIGAGTTATTEVRSTFVSDTESTTFTILPSWFSPAAQPGDKVVLIGAAPGPSDAATFTWSAFPGSDLFTPVSGGTYNPRARCTVTDYSVGGWTVTASDPFRVAAICLTGAVGFEASTPVQAFSPANPALVTHGAGALAAVVNILNYTTATITAPTTTPGVHQTIIDKSGVPRQIHVATLARSAAGSYDPGVATTAGGSEESTVFALVAQPTANSTFPAAPAIPPFTGGTLTTLSTLSANIASIVAAGAPGDRFQLVAGTYTNWSDVRPKTDMKFEGPASGVAVLEGTGKVWAFRAIDATGSSDNVVISGPTGSIKVQNYGAGTTRAEYGAIQAQPTDTSVGSTEYTYGHAQNWFIRGVELSKNGAQGILCSDYFTLYNVVAYGHNVSGVGGDRGVGGLMYGCTLDANGLNPATGAYSNGAGSKFTFWNANEGRTSVVPLASQRPKSPLRVVNTTLTATHAGVTGAGNIGLWFDLDCQLIELYGVTSTDHPWSGLVIEGCNNVYSTGCAVINSDGYSVGAGGAGENFILGGITVAESTNVTFENWGVVSSVRGLVVRQSNRSADWYNSNNSSFVNFAWAAGPRYWIKATGPLPVPGPSDTSNIWSGNITFRNGLVTLCDRIMLQEGNNAGGMSAAGSLPLSTIHFYDNDYSGSTNIVNTTGGGGFFDRSNTALTLAQWKALAFDRDQ